MFDLYMMNWSGRPIPERERMVMRRAAVEMRTVHGVREVEFFHDACAGIVRYERDGLFVTKSGLFFHGTLDEKEGQPSTMDFFIPRSALHLRASDIIVVSQTLRIKDDQVMPVGYPDDIDERIASGAGTLRIKVRQEN